MPVTSTNVATKGAEDTAGSAPSFFKMIGNIEPDNVPHNTTPISDTPTVNATSSQFGPYKSLITPCCISSCHRAILTKPIRPRMVPNNKPDKISLLMTRHQSEI